MAKKLHLRIPIFSTRATATLSVALVLVILGLAVMVGIVTGRVTDSVKENMGFVVVLSEDVSASDIEAVTARIKANGGLRDIIYSSPEVILDRWQKLVGEDEDIMRLAGVNPFAPELEVHVDAAHAHPDSIAAMSQPLELLPQVSEVRVTTDLIEKVSSTIDSITLTLVIVAVALLVVSFVLIFNTVRLMVYSRRFLINTMQLVGATPAFVRRPFLVENMVNGLVAGLIASGILAAILYGAAHVDRAIGEAVRTEDAVMVMLAMILTGILICLAASWVACNRYLSLSYDQLFK